MEQKQNDQVSNADALSQLRQLLPKAAFQRTPARLLLIILHVGIVFVCFYLASRFPGLLSMVAAVIISAHSLLCLGFLAHDLSHGSIVADGWHKEISEVFAWGLNLLSRTVWRKVHNQTHHAHYGTLNDPDRQFVESERGLLTWIYSFLFLPNREAIVGNPLLIVQLFFYNGRNLLAAFYPNTKKPSFVPAKPLYSIKDKISIAIDLTVSAVLQLLLFAVTGFNLSLYLTLVLCTYVLTSGFSMVYIFTNHALIPVRVSPSVLEGCTSVIVPLWCDVLHSYFSFHTEHHLFPTLNPKYYPTVSRLLAEKFPNHYQRIPILTAWRLLWKKPMFEPNPVGSIKS